MVRFAKPLEVNNLPLPQEANDIIHIRIVGQAEDIIVGKEGFLLCCQILSQIGNDIASRLNRGGGPAGNPEAAVG